MVCFNLNERTPTKEELDNIKGDFCGVSFTLEGSQCVPHPMPQLYTLFVRSEQGCKLYIDTGARELMILSRACKITDISYLPHLRTCSLDNLSPLYELMTEEEKKAIDEIQYNLDHLEEIYWNSIDYQCNCDEEELHEMFEEQLQELYIKFYHKLGSEGRLLPSTCSSRAKSARSSSR